MSNAIEVIPAEAHPATADAARGSLLSDRVFSKWGMVRVAPDEGENLDSHQGSSTYHFKLPKSHGGDVIIGDRSYFVINAAVLQSDASSALASYVSTATTHVAIQNSILSLFRTARLTIGGVVVEQVNRPALIQMIKNLQFERTTKNIEELALEGYFIDGRADDRLTPANSGVSGTTNIPTLPAEGTENVAGTCVITSIGSGGAVDPWLPTHSGNQGFYYRCVKKAVAGGTTGSYYAIPLSGVLSCFEGGRGLMFNNSDALIELERESDSSILELGTGASGAVKIKRLTLNVAVASLNDATTVAGKPAAAVLSSRQLVPYTDYQINTATFADASAQTISVQSSHPCRPRAVWLAFSPTSYANKRNFLPNYMSSIQVQMSDGSTYPAQAYNLATAGEDMRPYMDLKNQLGDMLYDYTSWKTNMAIVRIDLSKSPASLPEFNVENDRSVLTISTNSVSTVAGTLFVIHEYDRAFELVGPDGIARPLI